MAEAQNQNLHWWKRLDWVNTLFLLLTPPLAVVGVLLHLEVEGWNPYLILGFIGFQLAVGLSVTGGYHRLFAHRTYVAKPWVKFLYLAFGAAAFQNSAIAWCSDHRRHHRFVDQDEDPYGIQNGFFYAHMGWVMLKPADNRRDHLAPDLVADPLVSWQHRNYLAIAVVTGLILPGLIGWMMGSPIGGVAILGLVRIVFLHHCTFFINSACHMFGRSPYTDANSAKDSFLMALFTMGEGYHNFHHAFQSDYRNGFRWYHWDPTKWSIRLMKLIGWTDQLKTVPEFKIFRARLVMEEKRLKERLATRAASGIKLPTLESMREQVEHAQKRWLEIKAEYQRVKSDLSQQHREKLDELKLKLRKAKSDFKESYAMWRRYQKAALQLG